MVGGVSLFIYGKTVVVKRRGLCGPFGVCVLRDFTVHRKQAQPNITAVLRTWVK
jgi:hypothetical protein